MKFDSENHFLYSALNFFIYFKCIKKMRIEEEIIENYTADRPVFSEKDDVFQRYNFAKRISETIINRQSKESIVFGIFGAWGEGKTSVINFIKNSISEKSYNYIQITFNPWRFTDEAALLTSFFNTLASELKKNIPEEVQSKSKKENWIQKKWQSITVSKGEPLKTSAENIGELIQKYGKIAAIFGAGEVAETIGKAISNVDLDELKVRIETLLEENKKRIIIYLDDIDRLDKTEIHSIFRLVKLTGDFSYTTYILSFDQEMVASAIGERFGSGDKKAGESFLEKIIQVPLNIPKAPLDSLKKFCFKLVDNALNINEISLTDEEVQRFVDQFTTNVLPRLATPRLAVRYGNTLSFTMPLLKGEVNMVDLMLIEALRVFYPEHYYFVKDNSTYFIGSYTNSFDRSSNNQKKEEIKSHLETLGNNLSRVINENVKTLLSNLFPILDSVFGNYTFTNDKSDDWYAKKRIVSNKYFDRYFSYSVLEGDISDIEFEQLINNIDTVENTTSLIQNVLLKTTSDNFLLKIRSREKELTWSHSTILVKALCNISIILPKEGGIMSLGFETPFGQAAIFIYKIFKNHKETKGVDLLAFAKELMTYPIQFNFAYEINYWLRSGDRKEDKLFFDIEYQELAEILTKRAIDEAGEDSIFEKFSEYIHFLVRSWAVRDNLAFSEYVKSYLNKDGNNVIKLIKAYVPTLRSNARPKSYKGDLSEDAYTSLVLYIDTNLLFEKIKEVISIQEIEKEEPYWEDFKRNEFSELNMLRQFIHWYKEKSKTSRNGYNY
jgi:predicted KAP-like P-loop ATPase